MLRLQIACRCTGNDLFLILENALAHMLLEIVIMFVAHVWMMLDVLPSKMFLFLILMQRASEDVGQEALVSCEQ